MRHGAVIVKDHTLFIYYSRVGDAPERILMATVDMRNDWITWTPSEPVEVVKPSEEYEGALHSNAASKHGPEVGVNQLRDPFVVASGGDWMIFYTGAGELVVCGARIAR